MPQQRHKPKYSDLMVLSFNPKFRMKYTSVYRSNMASETQVHLLAPIDGLCSHKVLADEA